MDEYDEWLPRGKKLRQEREECEARNGGKGSVRMLAFLIDQRKY
jgi:hypothetical protein